MQVLLPYVSPLTALLPPQLRRAVLSGVPVPQLNVSRYQPNACGEEIPHPSAIPAEAPDVAHEAYWWCSHFPTR